MSLRAKIRPVTTCPLVNVIATNRVRLRRQCRGKVSGRSIPGEDTSRVYASSPSTSLISSASDTTWDTVATWSRLMPPSVSTRTRTTSRRPTERMSTSSSSRPVSCTAGSSKAMTWSRRRASERRGVGPDLRPADELPDMKRLLQTVERNAAARAVRRRAVLCCCGDPVVIEQLWRSL